MKNILEENYCASCWSISDLYPEAQRDLEIALESKIDFFAEWAARKEIVYATIVKNLGEMTIDVTTMIDDLPDLVDMLIWCSVGGNKVCSCGFDYLKDRFGVDADKVFDSILISVDDYYQQSCTTSCRIDRDISYPELMEILEDLAEECETIQNAITKTLRIEVEKLLKQYEKKN